MADRGGYLGRNPGDTSVRFARQSYVVSGATSLFTFSSGYDVGFIDVFLNGSKLVNGLDYTANDKQTVSLTIPAQSGDSLEFVAYKAFDIVSIISSSDGDFTAGGNITASGNIVSGGTIQGTFVGDGTQITGIVTAGGNGSNFTGIVTTITAGDNISVDSSTGNVTITGLANTSNVVADTLVVSGVGTFSGGVKGIGISSGGTVVTTDAIETLNFIGAGNTFKVTGSQVDISIQGGGGGAGLSTVGVNTGFVFSNPNSITTSIQLTEPGYNYGMFGPITISGVGVTVTVGAGNSFTIV